MRLIVLGLRQAANALHRLKHGADTVVRMTTVLVGASA